MNAPLVLQDRLSIGCDMARASSITALPKAVKEWLDKALLEGNFSGYQLLENELKEKGFDLSKSAIHRYGQKLESRLSAIRASTEAAKILAEGAVDEADNRSGAVIAMVQSDIFNILVEMQDAVGVDPKEKMKMLANVGRAMAELSRASISVKKYQTEVKTRVDAKLNELEVSAKSSGLDMATLEMIRQQIYGVL